MQISPLMLVHWEMCLVPVKIRVALLTEVQLSSAKALKTIQTTIICEDQIHHASAAYVNFTTGLIANIQITTVTVEIVMENISKSPHFITSEWISLDGMYCVSSPHISMEKSRSD